MKKGAIGSYMIMLVVVVILVLILAAPLRSIARGSNDLSSFFTTKDYDNDGKKDLIDPCPCGIDNVMQVSSAGTEYCIAMFNEEQCACANKIANLQAKEDSRKNEDSMRFIYADGKCLYTKTECARLLKYNGEFLNQITYGGIASVPQCMAAVIGEN